MAFSADSWFAFCPSVEVSVQRKLGANAFPRYTHDRLSLRGASSRGIPRTAVDAAQPGRPDRTGTSINDRAGESHLRLSRLFRKRSGISGTALPPFPPHDSERGAGKDRAGSFSRGKS